MNSHQEDLHCRRMEEDEKQALENRKRTDAAYVASRLQELCIEHSASLPFAEGRFKPLRRVKGSVFPEGVIVYGEDVRNGALLHVWVVADGWNGVMVAGEVSDEELRALRVRDSLVKLLIERREW